MVVDEAVEAPPVRRARPGWALRRIGMVGLDLLLLFGLPWWVVIGGPHWPGAVLVGGTLAWVGLTVAGVAGTPRSREVALAVTAVWVVLSIWGYVEARRVPRVRR